MHALRCAVWQAIPPGLVACNEDADACKMLQSSEHRLIVPGCGVRCVGLTFSFIAVNHRLTMARCAGLQVTKSGCHRSSSGTGVPSDDVAASLSVWLSQSAGICCAQLTGGVPVMGCAAAGMSGGCNRPLLALLQRRPLASWVFCIAGSLPAGVAASFSFPRRRFCPRLLQLRSLLAGCLPAAGILITLHCAMGSMHVSLMLLWGSSQHSIAAATAVACSL